MFLSSSPFTTNVEPGVDASRVRLSGAGVQDSIPASLPVTFLIDTREAGIADLEVLIKVRVKVHLREAEHHYGVSLPSFHSFVQGTKYYENRIIKTAETSTYVPND